MSQTKRDQPTNPKPKQIAAVLQLHLGALSSRATEVPPSMIQVMHNDPMHSCESSYASQEDTDPILNIMNAPPPTLSYLPRDFMPRTTSGGSSGSSLKQRRERERNRTRREGRQQREKQRKQRLPEGDGEDCWATTSSSSSSRRGRPTVNNHPVTPSPTTDRVNEQLPRKTTTAQLRGRLSSNSLSSTNRHRTQKRQRAEIDSILSTLSELQHNFVTNDNSDSNPEEGRNVAKEFAVRHFPNGDLFSGNVDCETKELIYGRMTCALEMEVYEGPFWRGRRHGEGAVCAKMDGGAKFLGRYHEGQMHSGTLIVTRGLPSDFTYTGTFLNNDFHGIGTVISQDGSIYQGQFARGQYHGVGRLRTVCDDDEGSKGGENNNCNNGRGEGKMESVYTGDFVEGLFHGTGNLLRTDGSSYIGTWSEGKRVEGTETLPNGDVFEGRFVDDAREGAGVLRTKRGRIAMSGVWEGDVLREGTDTEVMYEGHVYQGDSANSVPHGFGRMEYADLGAGEMHYTGWFVNGFRHGTGRCFFHKTGEEYEGEWVCDEPVGLDMFQHHGPLKKEEGEEIILEEDEDVVERSPTTSLHQLHSALSWDSKDEDGNKGRGRCHHKTDLNSSLVSECSEHTQESMTVSSVTPRTAGGNGGAQRNGSWRLSNTTDTDNLSLSIKSLSMLDCSDHGNLRLYRYENGDEFRGRLERGTNLRQGSGTYAESRMGSVYNGDWRDGKRHGVGHLKMASGMEYSGEFFEDRIHGQGSLTLIDGSVYTGSFFNGLFHGRGMLEDDSRNRVFFGEFENGERSGDGDETHPDGSRYKGRYRRGRRDGRGVLLDPDGREVYDGEWRDDLRHGRGRLRRHRMTEGSGWEGSYDGDFFRDEFSGNGRYTYSDGTSIEGQWLDDVPRDGDWSITYPDGSKFYGFATFQHPEERTVSSDGSSSTRGGLVSTRSREYLRVPLPHGYGSLTYPSGQRFVGSFVYGEYSGRVGKKS